MMGRKIAAPLLALLLGIAAACSNPVGPAVDEAAPQLSASAAACWGQASQVFAQMGAMGAHASQQANPRVGLANLARELYELGVIAEPTMQALGAFVASEEGLSIEACMS